MIIVALITVVIGAFISAGNLRTGVCMIGKGVAP